MSNVNYSFTQDGVVYDFDDIFVPAENFRQPKLFIWGSGYGNVPITPGGTQGNWKSCSSGFGNDAGIKLDGTLWVWGNANDGQNGNGDILGKSTPVTTSAGGTNWKYVSLGTYHCTAIKTDGTLWTWGRNSSGQLGVNDNTQRNTPVTTILGGTDWKYSDAGFISSSALKTDGTLWTWGGGPLGLNDNILRSTPTQVFGNATNWKSYSHSPSASSMAAIKYDGTLWTFGDNGSGQLGVNDVIDRSTPVTTLLGGNDWKSVAAGETMVAIKTDGTLWTWGNNSYGQLGINLRTGSTTGRRSTPVTTLLGGNNWKTAVVGYAHVLALKTDGTSWSWGRNSNGQLGLNDNINRSTPTQVFGNPWKSIVGSISGGSYKSSAIIYEPDP